MIIRESKTQERRCIREVHQNAFDQPEGPIVSQLAVDILVDKTAFPVVSLVAEQNQKIIGNIIFSAAQIDGCDKHVLAYILAPLAVVKEHRGKGIGKSLIYAGLETLKERGIEIVLVYGDPHYYTRIGFKSGHKLQPPHKLKYPEEAWMAQELVENALDKRQGTVRCASSLNSPEFW